MAERVRERMSTRKREKEIKIGTKRLDRWIRGERKRDRWSRGERSRASERRIGNWRRWGEHEREHQRQKKEFLGGGIERNGDTGNQRGITEKLEDMEEKSIRIRRKSD